MRKTFLIAAMVGLAASSMDRYANSGPESSLVLAMTAAGHPGVSSQIRPVKADSKLYDYCRKVIDDVQHGTFSSSNGDFVASDCIGIFIDAAIASGLTAAQPGQPGKGGYGSGAGGMPGGSGGAAGEPGQDGQGLPGLPGGKGGASGGSGDTNAEADVDEELLDYCDAVLKQSRRGSWATEPILSDDYKLSDCADYFASFDGSNGKGTRSDSGARTGSDGPSISGGQGGKGGEPGSGPGGGSGGAGGAGVGGG
jgi:hypothetical protein